MTDSAEFETTAMDVMTRVATRLGFELDEAVLLEDLRRLGGFAPGEWLRAEETVLANLKWYPKPVEWREHLLAARRRVAPPMPAVTTGRPVSAAEAKVWIGRCREEIAVGWERRRRRWGDVSDLGLRGPKL